MYDPAQFPGKVPLRPPPHHPRVIFAPLICDPCWRTLRRMAQEVKAGYP